MKDIIIAGKKEDKGLLFIEHYLKRDYSFLKVLFSHDSFEKAPILLSETPLHLNFLTEKVYLQNIKAEKASAIRESFHPLEQKTPEEFMLELEDLDFTLPFEIIGYSPYRDRTQRGDNAFNFHLKDGQSTYQIVMATLLKIIEKKNLHGY